MDSSFTNVKFNSLLKWIDSKVLGHCSIGNEFALCDFYNEISSINPTNGLDYCNKAAPSPTNILHSIKNSFHNEIYRWSGQKLWSITAASKWNGISSSIHTTIVKFSISIMQLECGNAVKPIKMPATCLSVSAIVCRLHRCPFHRIKFHWICRNTVSRDAEEQRLCECECSRR